MHRTLSIFAIATVGLLAVGSAGAKDVHGSSSDDAITQQCPAAAQWIGAYKQRMRQEVKAARSIKPSDPALTKELARRTAHDQHARNAEIKATSSAARKAAIEQMLAVDAANLAWFKPQVQAHGFPTAAQVGVDGIQNAWLLTQHADRDPAFQAKVLLQLKGDLATEPYMRSDYAMLADRLRLAQGEKQLYGSQFDMKHGVTTMRPLADPAHLDQRRAAMNLMPIADYRCVLHAYYAAPAAPASSLAASHTRR
ncbi:DUF6624 domain-containing protein [Oleiagrimonas sp. C23AA]|uniref:DUF6624 domain-containing protein n=1 Tax=Oleiagrimonas sp. C23AA TaxID=2719047 RepID=UPI00141FF370|nr:DUF6624 domain-containing protein [Oleiagrimonas sp. C23AA]NII11921.1 hypothetical protein [Oleiagrimonas sp. C23AA]